MALVVIDDEDGEGGLDGFHDSSGDQIPVDILEMCAG
jgi:hypothetical protein